MHSPGAMHSPGGPAAIRGADNFFVRLLVLASFCRIRSQQYRPIGQFVRTRTWTRKVTLQQIPDSTHSRH